ncbi:MAG: CoA transferase [Phenylobacterium sp.]|uniref:CaiB/BaiF CoA-transferase family protein n=1 Tax=Phenylobacterium sp. TaxID=1871053 RepID=UPI00120C34F8|nr:CoA transferase [Phenylobacterium sp.]TAJ72762.1 MAG: CoA transferase [Phenylobacterium sp.]
MNTLREGLPLAGLGVIETSDDIGARYCGRLFATLGGRVVRIEPDGAPPRSAFDLWLDEGKIGATSIADAEQAITAGGADPMFAIAGQDRHAVARADAALRAAGSDVLRLNLTWFAGKGPYADWAGDDALILSLCGAAYGFGAADGPPILAQGRAPQILGGATLFLAGLAALWGRKTGRESRRVDVDILESALCFTEHGPPALEVSGGKSARNGLNRYGAGYPTVAYRSSDGWIGVTAHTPQQWRALCGLVERPDLPADPRFASGPDRVLNALALDAELEPVFAGASTEHWLTEGQRLRIPMAPVQDPEALIANPHWRLRQSFAELAGAPGVWAPRLPMRSTFDGHAEPPRPGRGPGPLAGLRLIDFSMGWAGPLATRHLADLGVDVIKVETEDHFDWARGWTAVPGSNPPAHEIASAFNLMNRNKRAVALNLSDPADAAQAKALVSGADMVIENFGPGVMDKLGLSRETLRSLRPGLIFVSMAAFGAYGPWSGFRAYGSTVEHASGMPFFNGEADWPPSLQHLAYGDPVAGVYAAAAVLAALMGRERLGGGDIDLSQVECLFQLGAEALVMMQATGPRPRTGSRSLDMAPRCVAAAAGEDSWLTIACPDEPSWRALTQVLGRADWLADCELATVAGRNRRAHEIEDVIRRWASRRDPRAAAQTLQAAGVPAAPVLAAHDLADDPHLKANGTWGWLTRAHVGRHMMLAPPYRIDGVRPSLRTAAPLLGEHTAKILGVPAAAGTRVAQA